MEREFKIGDRVIYTDDISIIPKGSTGTVTSNPREILSRFFYKVLFDEIVNYNSGPKKEILVLSENIKLIKGIMLVREWKQNLK